MIRRRTPQWHAVSAKYPLLVEHRGATISSPFAELPLPTYVEAQQDRVHVARETLVVRLPARGSISDERQPSQPPERLSVITLLHKYHMSSVLANKIPAATATGC